MTSDDSSSTADLGNLSRREFFAGAGATAGVAAALGTLGGLGAAFDAQGAVKRQYFSAYVGLELDGKFAGLLESAEGGEPVIVLTSAGPGRSRAIAGVRYELLKLRLADMSPAMYGWIAEATQGSAVGRKGAVVTGDPQQETYRLAFQGARLVEIQLDPLEAGRREAARFTVTIAPSSSSHVPAPGGKPFVATTLKKSPLLVSNFRLYIKGLEATTQHVVSIDEIGLRGPLAPTPDRREVPTIGPLTPLPLRFQLALVHATPLYQWMNDTLAGKGGALQGELQLLDPTMKKVVMSLSFDQLLITRISYPAQSQRAAQLVEVECEAAQIKLNPGELIQ